VGTKVAIAVFSGSSNPILGLIRDEKTAIATVGIQKVIIQIVNRGAILFYVEQ
jgi:hypothetical protein